MTSFCLSKRYASDAAREARNNIAEEQTPEEIQLIRKLRQVSDKARTLIDEYVDYTWASKRMMNVSDDKE